MGYAYVNAQMLHREIDTLDPADMAQVLDFIGYLKGRAVKLHKRQKTEVERQAIIEKALTALQQSNAFSDISDPAEWQREIRKDRPLLGRD